VFVLHHVLVGLHSLHIIGLRLLLVVYYGLQKDRVLVQKLYLRRKYLLKFLRYVLNPLVEERYL
jgi:hypothetical protein